jgi:hypothetical protein
MRAFAVALGLMFSGGCGYVVDLSLHPAGPKQAPYVVDQGRGKFTFTTTTERTVEFFRWEYPMDTTGTIGGVSAAYRRDVVVLLPAPSKKRVVLDYVSYYPGDYRIYAYDAGGKCLGYFHSSGEPQVQLRRVAFEMRGVMKLYFTNTLEHLYVAFAVDRSPHLKVDAEPATSGCPLVSPDTEGGSPK